MPGESETIGKWKMPVPKAKNRPDTRLFLETGAGRHSQA